MTEWKPMFSAPRDGTPIIVVYRDLSGIKVVRWGTSDNDPPNFQNGSNDGWYEVDYKDSCMSDEHYGGWIKCPYIEEWHTNKGGK